MIFDFDGTIAETERFGHRVAYNEAFEELGLDDRWDEASYGDLLTTAGGRERLERYFAAVRPAMSPSEVASLARRVHETKRRRFAAIGPLLAPRPGVERFVREARAAGIRTAIATTASPDGVNAFFAGHGALGASFDVVVAGDDVPHKKPAPDIYLLALERLGCPPGDAVAIEDSAIGLQAALAAGVATIVTASGYTRDESFARAVVVLGDLGEPDRPADVFAGRTPPLGFVDVAFARAAIGAAG